MNFKEFRLLSEAKKDLYAAIGKEPTDKLLSTPVDPKVQTMHDGVFGAGKNHIEMPLENDVPSKVKEHIESNGDKLDGENVTLKTGRSAPISKYLAKSKAPKDVQDEHENWSRNKVANSKLVITRNPGEVASASTNTHWSSCAAATSTPNHNSPAWNAMPHELAHGTLMAMHVHNDAKPNDHGEYDSQDVLGRALIKRHDGNEGISFIREGRSYGAFPKSAKKAVDDFTSKKYPQKSVFAKKEGTLYNDDGRSSKTNYNHEDIEHAFTKGHPKELSKDQQLDLVNQGSPETVYGHATNSQHEYVLNSVAQNSKNPDTIRKVFNNGANNKSPINLTQDYAAGNPSAPHDIITAALNHTDHSVRRNAAGNSSATHEHILRAINDSDRTVRERALENVNLSNKHIDKILDGSDDRMQVAAISHPNVSSDNLHKAINSNFDNVNKAAFRSQKIEHQHITTALSSPYAFIRERAAGHHLMKSDDLHKSLKDTDEDVRMAATQNPHFTDDHVSKALDDSSVRVRTAALSGRRAISDKNIHKAMNDPEMSVRYSAILSPTAKREHLEKGLKDTDPYVKQLAQDKLDNLE